MKTENVIADHYLHGDLLQAIQEGIHKLGKTIENVTIEDLAPVDEFHIGGRIATEKFLSKLNFTENTHILDVGCGLGGSARFVAKRYNNKVTGIDLAQEYIDTGNVLCTWVNLEKQIILRQGSALSMPFQDANFDGCYMMHVGMNIEDKAQLFNEIYRVLRSGTSFGVYDIMRSGNGKLTYPVPWATDESICTLASSSQYKQDLIAAGFDILKENNRRDFALDFFEKLFSKNKDASTPPPLGLHTLMKKSTSIKIKNMIDNIIDNLIVPIEIIAIKS